MKVEKAKLKSIFEHFLSLGKGWEIISPQEEVCHYCKDGKFPPCTTGCCDGPKNRTAFEHCPSAHQFFCLSLRRSEVVQPLVGNTVLLLRWWKKTNNKLSGNSWTTVDCHRVIRKNYIFLYVLFKHFLYNLCKETRRAIIL